MKAKNIILVLFGVILSAMFSGIVAAETSNAIGGAVFALSIVGMFTQRRQAGILATLVNPAQVDWDGKQVMSMTEAIFHSTYANPELTTFHNIVENIVARQQIVYLGTLSKISKADTGCGGSPTTKLIDMEQKHWDPARVKFWLEQCADDLEESFWVWGLDNGIKRKDLTQGDFATFVMQRVEEALVEDIQRIVWFNDPDHTNVTSSPGLLTAGVDTTDYTIIQGLWSQIYDIVGADAARRYTITENNAGTYTLQDTLATDRALLTLRNLYQNADKRLKHSKNKFFILTDSLVDNYQTYLESQGVDMSFVRIQEGQRGQFDTGLRFRGIPIFCFDFWDRTIRADFDNGTTWYQPHRAILVEKANIPVGVDGVEAMKTMTQFYLPKEETTNWKGAYKIDTKVLKDYMIQVAY